ncbi:MAG TPA: nucleoside hydrolase [Steroidobacteraceae bacterium]|jgi:inosine-uridine nucleoside N-ribohydrolase|nr:nucleoside hydrolase [Steroidobacteraceae bacterium]
MRQLRIVRVTALWAVLLLAGLTGASAPVPARAADADSRPMVIIDQDAAGPAGSDMQSILMLMQDKDIDLLGICVVTGDAWRDEEVSHTLRLLEIAHRTAIPVLPGAVFPLLNGRRRTLAWEGLYGKLFYDGAYMSRWPSEDTVSWTPLHPTKPYWVPPLPEGEPTIHASAEGAAAFMLRMVHEHPHQVTIIAAGAMTDLALAARLDPRFASLARGLVFMGGSFNPVPADNPFAQEYDNSPRQEFNMRFDPEAASITLHQPWPSITEVPVDATSPTLMSRKLLGEVAKGAAPFDHYLGRFGQVYPLWDETAVAVWLDPSLITREKTLLVDVDTAFTANYGATLSWPVGAGPNLGERPVNVVFAVNVPGLDRFVVRLLTAASPVSVPQGSPRVR